MLAHYLLGHNIGGNTSRAVRRAVYFRIKRAGHDPRWREFLQDPWLDYDRHRRNAAQRGEYNALLIALQVRRRSSPPLPRAGSPLVAV